MDDVPYEPFGNIIARLAVDYQIPVSADKERKEQAEVGEGGNSRPPSPPSGGAANLGIRGGRSRLRPAHRHPPVREAVGNALEI